MKKCPTCNKTYADDSMSFCLEDGAPLLTVGGGEMPTPPNFDPNMTIPYTPPRDTTGQPSSDPYQGPGSQPGSQWPGAGGPPSSPPSGFGQPAGPPSSGGGYGQGGQPYGQSGGQYGGPPSGQFQPPQTPPPSNPYQPAPSWSPQPPPSYAPAAAKKSSALPWVLGGIGLLIVLGVVGAVIVGVLASMGSDTNKNNSNNSNATANKSNRNSNNSNNTNNSNANNSNANSNTTASAPALRDDFSSQKWWTGTVNVGSAWYADDEYHLKGNEGGYMVVYGPKTNDYHTENARVLVTARSVTGNSPSLGFGLSVFGEMKNNILEDYSFLIRTGAGGDPAYRIVLHQAGKETVLVPWTSSSVIRSGTSPNQLEVRSEGKKLRFYINSQYITSVNDDVNYGAGLAGLYTSDTSEVAFDDLEIYK